MILKPCFETPTNQMGQHRPKMGQHRRSGGIFATPVPGRSKVLEKKCFAGTVMRPRWPLGRAFLESILQHDLKMVHMDLMNDGSGSCPGPPIPLFRPSGSVSWNVAGHIKFLLSTLPCPFLVLAWVVLGEAIQSGRVGDGIRSGLSRPEARASYRR